MIGIIAAMHEEVSELLETLTNITETTLGNRTYYQGKLHTKEVVVVFSRWGKVAASITTTQLINSFQPDEIIFTGVAGGIDTDLNIGDIVLGKELLQHDMDASPLFPTFEIPLLNVARFNTQNNPKLEQAIDQFHNHFDDFVSQEHQQEFAIQNISSTQGIIASGDQFISAIEKVEDLKSQISQLSCVEMEGAAVAQVCYEYDIPFQIIRIISDKADQEAPIDFPKFVKNVASKYAKGILSYYCS